MNRFRTYTKSSSCVMSYCLYMAISQAAMAVTLSSAPSGQYGHLHETPKRKVTNIPPAADTVINRLTFTNIPLTFSLKRLVDNTANRHSIIKMNLLKNKALELFVKCAIYSQMTNKPEKPAQWMEICLHFINQLNPRISFNGKPNLSNLSDFVRGTNSYPPFHSILSVFIADIRHRLHYVMQKRPMSILQSKNEIKILQQKAKMYLLQVLSNMVVPSGLFSDISKHNKNYLKSRLSRPTPKSKRDIVQDNEGSRTYDGQTTLFTVKKASKTYKDNLAQYTLIKQERLKQKSESTYDTHLYGSNNFSQSSWHEIYIKNASAIHNEIKSEANISTLRFDGRRANETILHQLNNNEIFLITNESRINKTTGSQIKPKQHFQGRRWKYTADTVKSKLFMTLSNNSSSFHSKIPTNSTDSLRNRLSRLSNDSFRKNLKKSSKNTSAKFVNYGGVKFKYRKYQIRPKGISHDMVLHHERSRVSETRRYLLSVLVPIAIGIFGAALIIAMSYLSVSYRRKRRSRLIASASRQLFEVPYPQVDHAMLLSEISEDDF